MKALVRLLSITTSAWLVVIQERSLVSWTTGLAGRT
ncbi:hypothetical protein PPTG_23341 [Phytophthora nicotianae INRA-310]|uniref:RxLR effector protein n=1 Tax=Phytophthora nicotianae (strain INRA-310) TaxID=761204 RepID=W2Q0R5_PHYN3|nr:hypothetical protein PPTG_23341 [Phytophthora nicotianae INRA-310]ETN06707.1 hypothetical protein PPTG_23341 [Phytophthora nicotianae INRA-310]